MFIKKRTNPEKEALVKELKRTQKELEFAYENFEYVIDPDLIDSCIYQVNSIWHRYKFLLREVKRLSLDN